NLSQSTSEELGPNYSNYIILDPANTNRSTSKQLGPISEKLDILVKDIQTSNLTKQRKEDKEENTRIETNSIGIVNRVVYIQNFTVVTTKLSQIELKLIKNTTHHPKTQARLEEEVNKPNFNKIEY
ncbi:24463_t:CDS:2, partial [Gigaspora margarita]